MEKFPTDLQTLLSVTLQAEWLSQHYDDLPSRFDAEMHEALIHAREFIQAVRALQGQYEEYPA